MLMETGVVRGCVDRLQGLEMVKAAVEILYPLSCHRSAKIYPVAKSAA